MTIRLLLPAILAAVVGCSKNDADKPWDIGHVHPTGAVDDEYRGVKSAVEAHNKGDGRKIHVYHAPGGTPEETGAQALRMVALDGRKGIIGGSRPADAQKIAEALDKTFAVCTAGWAGSNAPPHVVTVGIAPAERARVFAQWVRENKPTSIGILRDPSAPCANHTADLFAADLRASGIPVVEGDAAAVFYACPVAVALKHRAGSKGMAVFGDDDGELSALLNNPVAEGLVVATAVDSGKLAEILAGDAFDAWAEAARRANSTDPAKMREELLKNPVASRTGQMTFAADGTARRAVFVGRIEGGAVKVEKRVEPVR